MIAAIVLSSMLLQNAETNLVAKYGEGQRPRIHRGLQQVAQFWRAEDGDDAAFQSFVTENFAGDPTTLDALFNRMQFAFESLDGHLAEISRDWKWQSDLDLGTVYPFDETMAAYDPAAHVTDDLYQNKLAFVLVLNFPLTTLDERLAQGSMWSRRQWAEAKLPLRFSKRVPSDVNLAISKASADASQYVATYNIWMHHLVDANAQRLFPPKMRLLEHWNLRDEIKAEYSLPQKDALPKQRMIQRVMERIVDQSIPPQVVDNPGLDWNPFTNDVKPATENDGQAGRLSSTDSDSRYAMILETFHAEQKLDPYSPTAPTHIARRFDEDRQIPEARVRQMLEDVLTSPLLPRVAHLIEKRLGRPLEPFDIWYNGFRPRGTYSEAQLDEIVRKRYPTADAYKRDMPNLLRGLGFSAERADYLAGNIEVDPARGSGHALPASRRGDNPHLRTRIGPGGMDYKGFNIAVHEMGHNVEQVFSLKNIDYYSLSSVPNTAFTEALAFVFQHKDLELLGLAHPTPESDAMQTLDDFWGTFEISGAALVDMAMWHWMYDHPDATPAQLKNAVVQISKDTWNRYYAPLFHTRDITLLGVYAHMVNNFMYLPDYPIGHLIAHQIEAQIEKAGAIGPEFERMAKFGSVTPDLWMIHATGAPVGAKALLESAQKALGPRP
ncbi:MAG TPA: hypothetical protein VF505_04055 [Thermoanaerobaculia bacterium]